ncbi:MAG: major facilitator superfamily domain-containing protein 9 [Chloroflexi bacterium]|nr:major facilitator superfamily domain-containing protein 9 [Chloroflexota bacterium]
MANEEGNTTARLDTRRVLPVFLLVFVDVLGLTVILPLLHLYAAAYGATPLQIGLTLAAFPLAQLVGVPVMGALSDRFGRKPLLLISQATTCLSFVMLGLATSLEMVILSRLIDGLFGANLATAQAALSDITDAGSRTRGLGIIGAAFGLGFIFGPVISLLALELSGSLAVPAFTAAIYSFVSILVTLFLFAETHPRAARGRARRAAGGPALFARYLLRPALGLLLLLMFAQQLIFFGYESLLGLFTLTRLGFLGRGNAALFILIGLILVVVQLRYIGRWSAKLGDRGLVKLALALLALGLLLTGLTPDAPHPFYVRELVQRDLLEAAPSQTEAIMGELGVELPPNGRNSLAGVLWLAGALIPVSVGAGLIRPALNSLLTQRVGPGEYGGILGVSAALVSAANAAAPLLAAHAFQTHGASAPFLAGGLLMAGLCLGSVLVLGRETSQAARSA